MKKTKDAIKYGIEQLKLSPDELFRLFESSQGYSGDDYACWLAGKIIEIAENDGLGYSQLLVKKFDLINSIKEEVSGSDSIRDDVVDIFRSSLGKKVYSYGLPELGTELEVDWFTGLDYNRENSFFVQEKFPEDLKSSVVDKGDVSLVLKLSSDGVNKKSELFLDAKGRGISISTKGGLLLYRLCSMAETFPMGGMKIGILCHDNFLYEDGNKDIVETFLSYYKIEEGYSIKSIEMSANSLNSGNMAWMVASPIRSDDDLNDQDGITLTSITLDDRELLGFRELGIKRYSRSRCAMVDKICSEAMKCTDDVYCVSGDGSVVMGKGLSDALGYLCIDDGVSLSSIPYTTGKSIPITRENLEDMVAYFGVTVSKEINWGYLEDIPCFIDGEEGYSDLLWNCLPLFLYDYKSNLRSYKAKDGSIIPNKLDVNNEELSGILESALPYLSFEAKELYYLCKEFTQFMTNSSEMEGLSFQEIRKEAQNSDFDMMYEEKLIALKEYINTLSKRYI